MTEKYLHLIEVFKQLSFINAVLGGFVFAYLGSLVTAASGKKILNWIIGISIFSAVCFIMATLLSTLSALLINAKFAADVTDFPAHIEITKNLTLVVFFLGLESILISLGLTGWLRSKTLGWISSLLGVIGVISVAITVVVF